jgi:hypothetical protein
MLSSRRFSLQGWQKKAGSKPSAATGTSPTRESTLKGLQTTRHRKSPVSSDTAFEDKAIGIMVRNRQLTTDNYTNTRREDVVLMARLWP